jgi:hypothetical protein
LAVGCSALYYRGSIWDALAFAESLALFSSPAIVIAAVFCGLFPFSVARHPTIWALGAVATAFLLCLPWFGTDAALSFVVSLPAGLVFMLSVWRWLLPSGRNVPGDEQ